MTVVSRRRTRFERWTRPAVARAYELRQAGLPYGSIATVLNLDFGMDATAATTRSALLRYCPDVRRSPRGKQENLRREAV